jgi:hypothetical protein
MQRGGGIDVRTVRIAFGALVALAVVIFLIVELTGGDDSDNGSSNGAVGLTEGELIDKAASLGHAFYWVGPRPGTDQYEFTSTPDGRFYVRYLTGGADPGDPNPSFLSVGTYVVPDAARALNQAASDANSHVISQNDYKFFPGQTNNAYVVFDDQPDLQIEIFSPRRGEAVRLATSGDLVQVGR